MDEDNARRVALGGSARLVAVERAAVVCCPKEVGSMYFYKKMIYLHHTISVFETVCTIAFCATSGTKLDHTCIYFDDVFHSCQVTICYHISCKGVYT